MPPVDNGREGPPDARQSRTYTHPIHHAFESDYRTVSAALNAGVPVTLNGSVLGAQLMQFTRDLAGLSAAVKGSESGRRRGAFLGMF